MTKEELARAHNENAQRAYQIVFGSPDGRMVLADLIAFCHGRNSEFDPDDRKHAFNSGKRAVLMRITEFTNLTLEEIYALRGFGRPIAQQEDTDG
jgi:hypothetical protein